MPRKIVILMLAAVSLMISTSLAGVPNDYLVPGRSYLFDGSLSGIRSAYRIFDEGLTAVDCPECQTNRELRFFRALAGTAMLLVRDDNNSINSIFELAGEFGVNVIGEYWSPYFEPEKLDIAEVRNQRDVYEIPDDSPSIDDIRNLLDASFIPEIERIINDLDSIDDSPEDRFRIYLQPSEFRVFFRLNSDLFDPDSPGYDPDSRFLKQLEVDYGEVLLLKGLMTALKAQLHSKTAYDIKLDPNDLFLEKIYGDCFNINEDLLDSYPDFMKVLPTANDPNDGTAILAQARQDWINAIDSYLGFIDYIKSEDIPAGTDPQDDELLYVDSDTDKTLNEIDHVMTTLKESLVNDTPGTYDWRTTRSFDLQDSGSTSMWQLVLNYGPVGLPDESAPGSLVAVGDNTLPSPWEITDVRVVDGELMLEMEYDVPGSWGGAFFSGMLSSDETAITDGTFSCWGPASESQDNLTGQLITTNIEQKQFDLNPVFGSSARYPDPVNPRDMLPVFDEWNNPQPSTIGSGLGSDATLGGILPGMTQYDWHLMLDMQPSGMRDLDFVYPWQITIDGRTDDWDADQLLFSDIAGDTEDEHAGVTGVDIAQTYLAYGWEYLYGAVKLHDDITDGYYDYRIIMSYSPGNDSALHSIRFNISISNGVADGDLYYMDADSYGWTWWQHIAGSFESAVGTDAVEFKVPMSLLPDYLPGRYIAVDSSGWNIDWTAHDAEDNSTHIKIGDVGTVGGSVSFSDYSGAAIHVQAYTDSQDPDGSSVARTMITEPGPYTLDGIGLGWEGFVRAYTPVFGFDNPFELGCFDIESAVPAFMSDKHVGDIDLALSLPIVLEHDVEQPGNIDAQLAKVEWFAFDAFEGGAYTIDLTRGTSEYACLELYGRDAKTTIAETYYWNSQQSINWLCPASGRYFVKVSNGYYRPSGGTYQIRITYDRVDFEEFALLARYWRGADCTEGMICFGMEELTKLADDWLGKMSHPYLDTTLGFETGDFATHGWQLSGDANWQVVSDIVYEGSFAAKSGSITHDQNSSMSLTVDTTGSDKISFAVKVSSEAEYDYLRFYVDGVEKADWSGEIDWAIVQYDITGDTHTFEWRYTKDRITDGGSDCTWIDSVRIYKAME